MSSYFYQKRYPYFFPLTVDYQERTYAAGKIPGGFFKREGRPTEKETLTCRLIDRPIRPLFPKGFRKDVQIVCTVMSLDPTVDPDIVALIASSAAMSISQLERTLMQGVACVVGIRLINISQRHLENTNIAQPRVT